LVKLVRDNISNLNKFEEHGAKLIQSWMGDLVLNTPEHAPRGSGKNAAAK